jgi:hypothetical protein
MCCWPLGCYHKPVSVQSAKTLSYYKPVSAKILWGRLPACGRLLIGPLLEQDAAAASDCIRLSQRRIANPPQVRQPAPQLQEQLPPQVQVQPQAQAHEIAIKLKNVGTPRVHNV